NLIVACSALKEKYRKLLSADIDQSQVVWVHLQGDYNIIYQRMSERKGHFMNADMLRSQFDAYEKPDYGILLNVDQDLKEIIQQINTATKISKSEVGLIGLGVMGTSLARNMSRNGFSLSIYNRHIEGVEEKVAQKMIDQFSELQFSKPFDDLEKFVGSLSLPRKIILMVNAGEAVDDVIRKLLPFLEAGDVIADGGNSHFKDTEDRQKKLASVGIFFLGVGVSGGEEGALLGPSIMPGGSREGFELFKGILLAIAARNELNEICCNYVGDGGAGHFVKMVHNGIEYADMQLIAEFYGHLRYDQQKNTEEIADVFENWNRGEANSYLLGITIDILRYKDADGLPLIDKISGEAGNKGTGSWTTITACELNVPVPAMTEALFSRYLSAFNASRLRYSAIYDIKSTGYIIESENLHNAYMFCRNIILYQGLKLIHEASEKFKWNINTEALLMIWSGGCIIRSVLLSDLRKEWILNESDFLEQKVFRNLINSHFNEIRTTVSTLTLSACPYPVTTSCLDYFKGLVSSGSNANLIQAQRDYFGAHTYKRTDDPSGKAYHTNWV
ncbi:MAG: decarboxylating NADP(+)-dependent phosphogluconate dehydrogenase, partial [Chitinophagaceae bacterium]